MISFEEVMQLTSGVSGNAAFEDEECHALYDLCAAVPHDGLVVEIGCQLGRTSSIILQCSPGRYRPVFIDPWTVQPDYMHGWMGMAHALDIPFTCRMMRTDQALPNWKDPIDLLLIDGDHTEHGVRIDTGMAEFVRIGGVMCAHDYGRDSLPDVFAVLNKYIDARWEFLGVAGTLGMWRRVA